MDEHDALDLLKTRIAPDDDTINDAKTLIRVLECIPLAISHAGSYIQMRPRITISTYLTMLQESEANLVHILNDMDLRDFRRDQSSHHATMATWQISFEQIRTSKPEASDMFALMSMFDRQGIPEHLLRRDMSRLQFEDAVTPLLSFSLIKEEKGHRSFEIHRLVQVSIRGWLESKRQLQGWERKAAEALATVFPTGEYETWSDCQVLLPHAKVVMNYISKNEGDLSSWAKLGHKVGLYLSLKGEYTDAEIMNQHALRECEKTLGPEPPNTLGSANNLGFVLQQQGKYKEAEAMYQRAVNGAEEVLGPSHHDTLLSTNNLGAILQQQGKDKEAEALYQQVLREREKRLGPDHLDTLLSVTSVGTTLCQQGKYKEAEAMYQRALRGREKILGPDHPNTLNSFSNLGLVLQDQGKYKEAEETYRWVLKEREKVLGLDHPDTLATINNLGSVLRDQGKYKEAEAMYRLAGTQIHPIE